MATSTHKRLVVTLEVSVDAPDEDMALLLAAAIEDTRKITFGDSLRGLYDDPSVVERVISAEVR